jgi:fatty acid desaturase
MIKLFRYREDRVPVLIISLFFALDIVAYFLLDNIWLLAAYWLIMIWPKGVICAWNHHHQHTPTFKSAFLNRLLEQMYALQTGATSKLWVLHHVLGHHHNYLDQGKDESRWKRKSGKNMGRMEYSFNVALTAYYRGYQVGKNHPRPFKVFLIATTVTLALLTAMFWYHPMPTLFVFILPMMVSLLFTAWVTYGHHSGLDVDNDFEASYNIMSPIFNLLTGNLGYHTAHHHKQGLHWSRLPALHEKIKDKIPERLFLTEHLGSSLLK